MRISWSVFLFVWLCCSFCSPAADATRKWLLSENMLQEQTDQETSSCVVDSSFISSFAASAWVAVFSLYCLFDSSMSCLDFFSLRSGDSCKTVQCSWISGYLMWKLQTAFLSVIVRMVAVFFQLKALKLLGMLLRFNTVKASLSSGIPQAA